MTDDPRIGLALLAYLETSGKAYSGDGMRAAFEAYRAHPLSKLEAAVVEAVGLWVAERRALHGPLYSTAEKALFTKWDALQAEREKQDG